LKGFEFNKEEKQEMLNSIKQFYLTIREEDISDFKASIYLDFILKEIGPYIYNQALDDAHQLMVQKIEELYDLEKRAR
jgi:uncharacterized protein (DUF2164 family)